MYYLLHGIKRIIERYIINMTPLSMAVNAGETFVPLTRTRRYQYGDTVVIYNRPAELNQPEGEVHNVLQVCEGGLIIDSPLVGSYPLDNSYVEKMVGYEQGNEAWFDAVYIGDPDGILRYPAITINGVSRSSEWITLSSTKETYDIDITVYVTQADYELQMEMMYACVKQIESALFRSLYPLIEPYTTATLVEPLSAGSYEVKVDNENLYYCMGSHWIFLESNDYLKPNYLVGDLGSGVYRLQFPACVDFEVGDTLILPGRHFFNALPKGTQYGSVHKGSMLKAAKISFRVEEEVWRYVPFADPLTF